MRAFLVILIVAMTSATHGQTTDVTTTTTTLVTTTTIGPLADDQLGLLAIALEQLRQSEQKVVQPDGHTLVDPITEQTILWYVRLLTAFPAVQKQKLNAALLQQKALAAAVGFNADANAATIKANSITVQQNIDAVMQVLPK